MSYASRRREQRRLCKDTTEQPTRQCMHRNSESRPDYASLLRSTGSDPGLGLLAAYRVAPRPRLDGESSGGASAEKMHRYGESSASAVAGQTIAAAEQRQRQNICIATATARAAQTMRGYNGDMAQICIGTASAAQTFHGNGEATIFDGERRADYAWLLLQRNYSAVSPRREQGRLCIAMAGAAQPQRRIVCAALAVIHTLSLPSLRLVMRCSAVTMYFLRTRTKQRQRQFMHRVGERGTDNARI